MNCQECERPATVHLEKIVKHQKTAVHLCEECARRLKLIPDDSESAASFDPVPLLSFFMGPLAAALAKPGAEPDPVALTCGACGLKYGEFRAEGRLGCAKDYDEFRQQLEPLLERIHRSVIHEGKTPRAIQRKKTKAEVRSLRKKLQQAVQAERYEDAAKLRDLIREKEAQDESR
jgi:protein arginine kinase activator